MAQTHTRLGRTLTCTRCLVSGFVILATLWTLSACFNASLTTAVEQANRKAEADGSPFRFRAKSIPGGTMLVKVLADLPSVPSRADAALRRDTLHLIAQMESAAGRPEPQLEDVKTLRDGREVWLLKTSGEGIAYLVDFKPSAQGGTDIGLSKPLAYQKD